MRSADERDLVVAAQRGDRRAQERLARACLPLVYNAVQRALDGHPDVDDVVQDVMMQVVRSLPTLRRPESVRAWILAIAVHRIGAWQRRAHETAPLADAAELPDAGAAFEELAILRLRLSDERRQVAAAARWLDADDRTVLALWWQEAAGELTRSEVAQALGTSVAYAGVRIQRMRSQLDRSRTIVAALAGRPRCAGLATAAAGWDGRPTPLWRKRLDRHVRDCRTCLDRSTGAIDVERLLVGCALLPVPATLAATLLSEVSGAGSAAVAGTAKGTAAGAAKGTTAGAAKGTVASAVSAHPALSAVAAAMVLVVGAGVAYTALPNRARPAAQTSAVPSAPVSAAITSAPPRPSPTRSAVATTKPAAGPAACGTSGLSTRWANWPMPGPGRPARYTDQGDGTVRDVVTCLTWQRVPAPRSYTFTAAKAYCTGLALDGGGWRLPSRIELTSITDTTRTNPAIDRTAFPGTPARYFWTSSPWAVTREPLRAWIINFYEGLASNAAEQSGEYHVRCVRSRGVGSGRPAYRIADGQVTDPATGLTWQRARSDTMTAAAATAYCADLRLGGKSWRLPTIQELATTVDETKVAPAIDRKAFPGTAEDALYWSSTRSAPTPATRWALNYDDGFTTYRRAEAGYARCVRSR